MNSLLSQGLWKEFWCHHEWILQQLEEAAPECQRIPDDDEDEEEEVELEKKRKKLDSPQLDAKRRISNQCNNCAYL
jgi:hypothetical protein